MKDGYYECDVCPRWFKVVDGKEIELIMSRDHEEILSNNIILLEKGQCEHKKLRRDQRESMLNYNRRRALQDNSRFHSFIG